MMATQTATENTDQLGNGSFVATLSNHCSAKPYSALVSRGNIYT